MRPEVHMVNVFPAARSGGNLAPTVACADCMSATDMQAV